MRTSMSTAPLAVVAVMIVTALGGCALYSHDSLTDASLNGGDSGCGYQTNYRCGYYGDFGNAGQYLYTHAHSGWQDGFHGHVSSTR